MQERRDRGEFTDPAGLPEFQRGLHRRVMAAIRRERQAQQDQLTEDERRWPGLVKAPTRKRRRTV